MPALPDQMSFSAFRVRRLLPGTLLALLLLQGCGRFGPHPSREYVWVWAKEAYLHDRVAPVNNRVATVVNGERLQVIEHANRFLRVETDKGQIGWIEDHGVIDQRIHDEFLKLQQEHAHDQPVTTATLREDYWMRDAPGRESDRFYLLPENAHLQLLVRASVPKAVPPQALPLAVERTGGTSKNAPGSPPTPDLEDYWLVRDSAGHVGWVRGHTLDDDVPDAIAGLSEMQKVIAAYVLRSVADPDANVPGGQVPEYLTLLAPWQDGLPYDFNQIRVFTWNTRKHRYETAYRERGIEGYLPVTVSQQTFGNQQDPAFSFRVATTAAASVDPKTGLLNPGPTETESYRMEGVIVRRIGGQPPAHLLAPAKEARRREKSSHRHRR